MSSKSSKCPLQIIDEKLLDCFWKLAEKDKDVRIKVSTKIINLLLDKQNTANNSTEITSELEYAIDRLIKGLASSREASRLGYSLVLTQILKKFDYLKVETIFNLINKHLSFASKHKQEKKNLIFGQLFAYVSLIRSRRLERENLLHVVTSLYQLTSGKLYLHNFCYEVFLDLFTNITEQEFKQYIWSYLKKEISTNWETCTLYNLYVILLSHRYFPTIVNTKYLQKKWGNEDLFCKENFEHLKRLMTQTTAVLPKLHPFCLEFLVLISKRNDAFEIWNAIIDENMLEVDRKEKAYVSFEMIKELFKLSPKKKLLKKVLSPRFCAIFVRSYMNNKHPLNSAAVHLANFFCEYVNDHHNPDIQISIMKSFLHSPGTRLVGQVLSKKEVRLIIQRLHPDAIKSFCEILKAIIVKEKTLNLEDDEDMTDNKKLQAVLQIGSLISHSAMLFDIEWRLNTIKFLFLIAFFNIKKPNPNILHCDKVYNPLPNNLREAFVNNFYRSLDSLCYKIDNENCQLDQFLQHLLTISDYVEELMEATDYLEPLFHIEKVKASWEQTKSSICKLRKQTNKNNEKKSRPFELFFIQLRFAVFNDSEKIPDLLEELHICCKKALKERNHAFQNSKEENNMHNENAHPWTEVVVDIMLSLISRKSHHIHQLVKSVFKPFCSFITQEALQQILDVLNSGKDAEESMLVDESEDDKSVEFESGESSSDEELNNEITSADNDFRKKVQDALGTTADVSDIDSEVIMSDSEMFKIDDALSEAFRSRLKTGHTKFSEEDETLMHFKIRCLDLMIIYLKSKPSLYLILYCIKPILTAYEHAIKDKNQRPLVNKITTTIQLIAKVKKVQHSNDINKSIFEDILDTIIYKCHKETDIVFAKHLYSLFIYILSHLRRLESTASQSQVENMEFLYITKFTSILESFINQSKSHVLPLFFVSVMNSYPETAWHLMKTCMTFAFQDKIRIHKKSQCLGIMLEALKFSKKQNISSNEWLDFGKYVIPATVKDIKTALSDSSIKPLYLIELLNFLYAVEKLIKKQTGKSLIQEHSDLLPLLTNIDMKELKKNKNMSLLNNIAISLGGSMPPKEKKRLNVKSNVPEINKQEVVESQTNQTKDFASEHSEASQKQNDPSELNQLSSKAKKHKHNDSSELNQLSSKSKKHKHNHPELNQPSSKAKKHKTNKHKL